MIETMINLFAMFVVIVGYIVMAIIVGIICIIASPILIPILLTDLFNWAHERMSP